MLILKSWQQNEIILVLDAGGGTVDAVTYQITNSYPLRLSAEVVEPGSMYVRSVQFLLMFTILSEGLWGKLYQWKI